jgi:transcriptional regulator with XRE-family HTH domain
VSRIERDVVSPSVDMLAHLLDLLGEELALEARPIDYGHDVTLLQLNLAGAVADRVRRQAAWAHRVRELQRGIER